MSVRNSKTVMAAPDVDNYDSADSIEKNQAQDYNGPSHNNGPSHLKRLQTAGGHDSDRTQPSLPVVHRTFANPSPLGLLSFATGIPPQSETSS